jgi:hypothetical protein
MRSIFLRGVGCAFALALCAGGSQAAEEKTAQPAANLSGVWLAPGGGLNPVKRDESGNPESQWSKQRLPFTREGRAAYESARPSRGPRAAPPNLINDPQAGSNPNGLYRSLTYPRAFYVVQTPEMVVQLFGWGLAWRAIHTDGRPVPDEVPAGPYWFGYSVGRWEGDTLVLTTQALDERQWLDEWGTPYSADARFEERWKRIAPDKLQLQLTVNDPAFYSKPWTSQPIVYTLQRGRDAEPIEMIFSPMDMQSFDATLRVPAAPK